MIAELRRTSGSVAACDEASEGVKLSDQPWRLSDGALAPVCDDGKKFGEEDGEEEDELGDEEELGDGEEAEEGDDEFDEDEDFDADEGEIFGDDDDDDADGGGDDDEEEDF